MPPEQQFVLPNQMPVNPISPPQAPQIGYAGFWLRFLALALDNFIVSLIFGIPLAVIHALVGSEKTFFVLGMGMGRLDASFFGGIPLAVIHALVGSEKTFFVAVGAILLHLILAYTYFIFLTNKNQGTIGKRLLGLRVVAEDGASLSFWKIVFRETIGKIISLVVLSIGFFMVAFTSKKQGLHDKMVGSVVLSNPAERKKWAVVVGIVLSLARFWVVIVTLGFFLMVLLTSV